jgi:hypothetical protein
MPLVDRMKPSSMMAENLLLADNRETEDLEEPCR